MFYTLDLRATDTADQFLAYRFLLMNRRKPAQQKKMKGGLTISTWMRYPPWHLALMKKTRKKLQGSQVQRSRRLETRFEAWAVLGGRPLMKKRTKLSLQPKLVRQFCYSAALNCKLRTSFDVMGLSVTTAI